MALSIDRHRGCLLGLATGDALGTTLEFSSPGSFRKLEDMVGGGPFNLKPGEWTDDTSMALCLAESLIEHTGFRPHDQMNRYLRWYREGYLSSNGRCFDIGNTIRSALEAYDHMHEIPSAPVDLFAAGNGSIMRLAPVPMFYAAQPAEAIQKSGESSLPTHSMRAAVDACRYLGGLIVGALNGTLKEELLSDHYSPAPGVWQSQPLMPAIDEIAAGSFKKKQPPDIHGSGYVVSSLEAALWAFYRSESFREGALLAVNLGEDADTTGAVYGQIAGAYYGEQDIPAGWREKLALREKIESFAEQLFLLAIAQEA